MPITYEPPQPVSPAISTGYGALQQENIDWDRQYKLAALQAELTSRNLGRGGGGGGLGGGFRGDQGSALTPQGAADPMAMQQNAAALHEQAAISIQNNALSQSEAIQLQRMQQADGYIRQQVEANNLTPDEAQDALTRLHTGISTLQQRQARAQVQRQQQQNQLLDEAIRQQAAHEQTQREFRARGFAQSQGYDIDPQVEAEVRQELSEDLPDGEQPTPQQVLFEVSRRGGARRVLPARVGDWTAPDEFPGQVQRRELARPSAGAGRLSAGAAARPQEQEGELLGPPRTAREFDQARNEITRSVAAMRDIQGKPLSAEEQQARRDELMVRAGIHGTYQEYLDRESQSRQRRREARPVTREEQRQQTLQHHADLQDRINSTDMQPVQRAEMNEIVRSMQRMTAGRGGYQNLSPRERARYRTLLQTVVDRLEGMGG